ncbi:YceD family protein [Bacillus songklensis]|uniref:YceD family protein n=1 Tax=Bacillus songklensis TaxID=1069116 RepID=A0ABV8B0D1_9BACI
MKWSVHQLYKLQQKGLKLDEYVDMSEAKEVEPQIRAIKPVHVTGRADISTTKVTFHLNISGEMTLPCSRTLVDVPYPFQVETTETFMLKPVEFELEEDVHYVKGEVVDLDPIIKEHILLEVPMQVFCENPNAEGAAPQSGKDWEVVTEQEKIDQIDPRLAALQNFFKKDDKK